MVVGFYTFFTYRQLKLTTAALERAEESNDLARQSLELGREAFIEAQVNNDFVLKETMAANESTIRIAQLSLELGKRAWLVIAFKSGPSIGYHFEVTNVGEIPATDVELWYSFDVWEGRMEAPDEILPRNNKRLEKGLVVGAKLAIISVPPTELHRPLNDKQSAAVTCYCKVTYRDFFERPRESVACWQFKPKTAFDLREWVPKQSSLK
jgi:hypothetical protein